MPTLSAALSLGKWLLLAGLIAAIAGLWYLHHQDQKTILADAGEIQADHQQLADQIKSDNTQIENSKAIADANAAALADYQKKVEADQAIMQEQEAKAATLRDQQAAIQKDIDNAPSSTCKSPKLAAVFNGMRKQSGMYGSGTGHSDRKGHASANGKGGSSPVITVTPAGTAQP